MATAVTPSGQRVRLSKPGPAPQGRIYNHELHELVFGTLYTGLMTNFLLLVTTLPIVVLLFTTDVQASWPALALLAPLAAPAAVGAFAVFHAFSRQGSTQVIRTFFTAWRTHLRRSLAIGVVVTVVAAIATLNVQFLMTTDSLGALAIPFQAVMLALVALGGLVALVATPELPGVRLRELARASLAVAVRRFYLTVPALGVLGMLFNLLVERPAIAIGVAAAPLCFAAWGACRFALKPLLGAEDEPVS